MCVRFEEPLQHNGAKGNVHIQKFILEAKFSHYSKQQNHMFGSAYRHLKFTSCMHIKLSFDPRPVGIFLILAYLCFDKIFIFGAILPLFIFHRK